MAAGLHRIALMMHSRPMRGFTVLTTLAFLMAFGVVGLLLLPPREPAAPRSRPAALPAADLSTTTSRDSFGDGLPDALRLEDSADRERFRRWFSFLAEMQYYYPNADAGREVDDCAALIRYAFHEALRRHDGEWRRRFASPVEFPFEDVGKYSYPRTPVGTALFRTRPGPLRPSDLGDGTFREFADASALVRHNTHAVGRSPEAARKGDLMVFFQPRQSQPYHTMIYVGSSELVSDGRGDWVVYHTGADPGKPGEIKKVPLEVLSRHPAARWRPVAANSSFLGFYRFNILR